MLRVVASHGTKCCDGLSRRELLRAGALGFGGLSLPHLLQWEASAAPANHSGVPGRQRRIKSVVVLYLSGGPSHLDMWDLKPQAPEEIRGTFQPISTNVPNLMISEHMPRMARIADKYSIVRSMTHDEADHIRGGYWVMTGGRLLRPVVQASGMKREDRPHLGSALDLLLGSTSTLPSFVMVPEYTSPVGVPRPGQYAGFLGPAHDPYLINSDPNLPDYDPGPMRNQDGSLSTRLKDRRSLLSELERPAVAMQSSAVHTLDSYKQRAFDLISSPEAQRAFDVAAESAATRDRYGRHVFGQATLVARRLVEAGVRLVHVNFVRHDNGKGGQGYDSHSAPPNPPHLTWAKNELLPPTDAAFASLVEDLSDRGMLEETLVVMMGEFGRTPRFNKDGGRDHWPQCYSLVVAGGGTRGGFIYGASDRIGAFPTADPVSPIDLLATICWQLGLDPHATIYDGQGRPHPVTTGHPIHGLLA